MLENEIRAIFSRNLKKYMEIHDLNNVELSRIIGVSESTVGKWLLQKSLPRMGVVEQLANYFKINKSDLLEDKDSAGSNYNDADENYYHDPEAAALADMIKDNPRYRVLFEASRDLSKENIDFVIKMIENLPKGDEDFSE